MSYKVLMSKGAEGDKKIIILKKNRGDTLLPTCMLIYMSKKLFSYFFTYVSCCYGDATLRTVRKLTIGC